MREDSARPAWAVRPPATERAGAPGYATHRHRPRRARRSRPTIGAGGGEARIRLAWRKTPPAARLTPATRRALAAMTTAGDVENEDRTSWVWGAGGAGGSPPRQGDVCGGVWRGRDVPIWRFFSARGSCVGGGPPAGKVPAGTHPPGGCPSQASPAARASNRKKFIPTHNQLGCACAVPPRPRAPPRAGRAERAAPRVGAHLVVACSSRRGLRRARMARRVRSARRAPSSLSTPVAMGGRRRDGGGGWHSGGWGEGGAATPPPPFFHPASTRFRPQAVDPVVYSEAVQYVLNVQRRVQRTALVNGSPRRKACCSRLKTDDAGVSASALSGEAPTRVTYSDDRLGMNLFLAADAHGAVFQRSSCKRVRVLFVPSFQPPASQRRVCGHTRRSSRRCLFLGGWRCGVEWKSRGCVAGRIDWKFGQRLSATGSSKFSPFAIGWGTTQCLSTLYSGNRGGHSQSGPRTLPLEEEPHRDPRP